MIPGGGFGGFVDVGNFSVGFHKKVLRFVYCFEKSGPRMRIFFDEDGT